MDLMKIGDWKRIDKPPEWNIVLGEKDGVLYSAVFKAKDFDDAFIEKLADRVKSDQFYAETLLRLLMA